MKTVTIEQVREMAASDAIEAYGESESTQTPDGGWDAWLINGIGGDAACRLFGESPEENQSGWSSAMAEKLEAYNAAATDALLAMEV